MAVAIVQSPITRHIPAGAPRPYVDRYRDPFGNIDAADPNYYAYFVAAPKSEATGVVRFTGGPRDKRNGWRVGWIQVQLAETDWAMYRGQHSHDGSIFIQRGKGNGRAARRCRDTYAGPETIFTHSRPPAQRGMAPQGAFPLDIAVIHQDEPGSWYPLIEPNSLARNNPNYLDEVQIELLFCAMLTAMDGTDFGNPKFYHLAHYYWSARWHYYFRPKKYPPGNDEAGWTITPAESGNGASARVFQFPPTDPRVTGLLTSPQIFSCNALATKAANSPGWHEYPDRDHMPDVRRP